MVIADTVTFLKTVKDIWESVNKIKNWLRIDSQETSLEDLVSSSTQQLERAIQIGVDKIIDKIEQDKMEELIAHLKTLRDLLQSGILKDKDHLIQFVVTTLRPSVEYAKNRLNENKLQWFTPYCIGNILLQATLGTSSVKIREELENELEESRQIFLNQVLANSRHELQEETRLVDTLRYHDDVITSICFSPNGKLIASGSFDQTVKIWDVASSSCLRSLKNEGTVYTGSIPFL